MTRRSELRRRLLEVIRQFRGLRVVVLGDVVCDEFVYGDIARVSREAPVLILDHRRTDLVPGGAGNAAANLRALGAHPLPVGVVGRDDPGRSLVSRFARLRIDPRGLRRESTYRTPTKRRILAGGSHTRRQQIVRLDDGAPRGELSPAAARGVERRLRETLRDAQGLLVADYGYGAATPAVLETIRRRNGGLPCPVVVDSRWRVERFAGVTACTPNQQELENVVGAPPLETERAVTGAARKLLRLSGDEAALVTRGPRGMTLVEREKPARHLSAYGAGEVADVTGAGDTVIAVFTLAIVSGAPFLESAMLANYAAGLVVMKYGTATVTRSEIAAAVEEDLRE